MCVFGVKITANQAFLIFSSLHFCFLVLFTCLFSTFSQSSGTLGSLPHLLGVHYQSSNSNGSSFEMFPKPDPFFSFTVSPHANQSPMKKPPKSCPVFQLAGDFDSDTSDGTARIRFPRTQSPSTSAPPGVQREVSAEKP